MDSPDAPQTLTLLGLESSCDETAAAVVRARLGPDGRVAPPGDILADLVLSQIEDHAPYAGVVPEIAARAHVRHLDALAGRAMDEAGLGFGDLDGVAATAGPGLIGGVMVALMTGKGIALAADKPLIAINHLEGHGLSPRLVGPLDFPYLLLLMSGGHCQLLEVAGPGRCRRLGTTIDDAVGEAFDKVAKLLGLGFPGGPALERWAARGRAERFDLPRPMLGRPGADFSFSGLKTAVLRAAETLGGGLDDGARADLAAGFQAAIIDCLKDRAANAMADFAGPERVLVIAGGVAANRAIRAALAELCAAHDFRLVAPPPRLCADNAAMIAWAGAERLALGDIDLLTVRPRARWPLDENAAAPGAKA